VKGLEGRGVRQTLACALAFLAYVATLGFQFVYDDKPQIVQNPAVHAWRYLPRYFTSHVWAEISPRAGGNYYRPLFLVWFRLNHALFGLNPQGWHLTTVLWHVLATYLVFVLVARLAADRWVAFSASTLFALHPVHMESVAWVSGVTDPMMACFLIGSFLAYLRFREANRSGWMSLALLLFSLALLAKETAVVMVPLVFVYAWLYGQRSRVLFRFVTALVQSLPFFLITALYLVLRAHALRGLSHAPTQVSWGTMALTWPSLVWLYVRHLLMPVGLSGIYYGLPYIEKPSLTGFVAPLALLLALVAVLAWAIRRMEDARLALFACCWIVLPILPVLWLRVFFRGDIAHDRYLYLPSIGFVLLLSLVLREMANHWPAHSRTVQLAGVAVLAVAYAWGTLTQQIYWASDLLLYQRAFQLAPRDSLAGNDFATALMDAGRPDNAIALYSQVLAQEPGFWLSNYNLGLIYYRMGKFKEAESFLQRAISINGADPDEYIYLALSLTRQGRLDEAAQYAAHAIQLRPSAPGYHFVMAVIREAQKEPAAAESELSLELQVNPGNAAARQQLNALTASPAPAPKNESGK
jgi:tetratricopeptide (TPR) repeat protein